MQVGWLADNATFRAWQLKFAAICSNWRAPIFLNVRNCTAQAVVNQGASQCCLLKHQPEMGTGRYSMAPPVGALVMAKGMDYPSRY